METDLHLELDAVADELKHHIKTLKNFKADYHATWGRITEMHEAGQIELRDRSYLHSFLMDDSEGFINELIENTANGYGAILALKIK